MGCRPVNLMSKVRYGWKKLLSAAMGARLLLSRDLHHLGIIHGDVKTGQHPGQQPSDFRHQTG